MNNAWRYLIFFVFLNPAAMAAAQDKTLPSAEQFDSLIGTCALGLGIEADGRLRGALTNIYSGVKSEIEANKVKILKSTTFLDKIPEADRLKALQLYFGCIEKILDGKKDFGKLPDVFELNGTMTTNGKPLHIKAKTIIAKNAEIWSFDQTIRAGDGVSGRGGAPGDPGATGSGARGGNGNPGTNGTGGNNGQTPGEVRLEAEQFLGQLKIFNVGQMGGQGGSGGAGGNGGPGGSGANGRDGFVDCAAGPGNGGDGGNAGKGGDGGRGGDGGAGGLVALSFDKVQPGSSVAVNNVGGAAGTGGEPGKAGMAGGGGPRGSSPGKCNAGGRGPGGSGAANVAGQSQGNGQKGADGQIQLSIGGQVAFGSGTLARSF